MGCCQAKPYNPAEGVSVNTVHDRDAETEVKEDGFFTGILHKAQDMVSSVKQSVNDAVDFAKDPYDTFEQKLEVCVVKTLSWVSPKCSEKVQKSMSDAMPGLEKSDMVMDKTEETVHGHIMEQKHKILDMCQDVLEMMQGGMGPLKALKTAFKRVGTLICRVVKGAISAGFMVIQGFIGCLSCICGALVDIKNMVEKMFTKIVKMLKNHLKKLLKKKAPDFLVDKLPWNWTADTDIGDETPLSQKKREEGQQTARQKKGLPEYEAKAEKEANKPPRGVLQRNKLALAAGGAGALAAGGAAAAAYELSTDDDDESDYDDDSDEGESDGYDDFDNEAGDPSEDEEEAAAEEEAQEEEAQDEEAQEEEAQEEEAQEEEAQEEEALEEEAQEEEEEAEEDPPEEEEEEEDAGDDE